MLTRSEHELALVEKARQLHAGRWARKHERRDHPALRAGEPGLGRERKRVHRLPHRLRADVRGTCPPPGHRRGARAGRARLDLLRQQPARHRARGGDRRRGAVRRASALRQHRHRGGLLRDAARAELQRPRQDPQVRGRLPRDERHRASRASRRNASPTSRARSRTRRGSRPASGTKSSSRRTTNLDAVANLIKEHGDEIAGLIVEPVQRIIPPVAGFLEGLRELTDKHRHRAHLRRGGNRLPHGVRRRAGVLRSHPGPLHPRQGVRRRLPPRGHRRAARTSCPCSTRAGRRRTSSCSRSAPSRGTRSRQWPASPPSKCCASPERTSG